MQVLRCTSPTQVQLHAATAKDIADIAAEHPIAVGMRAPSEHRRYLVHLGRRVPSDLARPPVRPLVKASFIVPVSQGACVAL